MPLYRKLNWLGFEKHDFHKVEPDSKYAIKDTDSN